VLPFTAARLSMRLPPRCDADAALASIVDTLTAAPPYGAPVTVSGREHAAGWDAPPTVPWLAAALHDASLGAYGQPPGAVGIGGTIPFMAMLGQRFPDAQFVVTGVLGPGSNAHGPNEFLHLPTARRVTACVAHVLDAHTRSTS
jgi:acetylornithine deacetylase/succinyl-diaminopimelate desuccinylase-like protein